MTDETHAPNPEVTPEGAPAAEVPPPAPVPVAPPAPIEPTAEQRIEALESRLQSVLEMLWEIVENPHLVSGDAEALQSLFTKHFTCLPRE